MRCDISCPQAVQCTTAHAQELHPAASASCQFSAGRRFKPQSWTCHFARLLCQVTDSEHPVLPDASASTALALVITPLEYNTSSTCVLF